METTGVTPQTLAEVEEKVFRDAMDRDLADLSARLQQMADAMPAEGSYGRRLRRTRRIGMEIDTSLGKARIMVLCGQCKSTGGWETPFRDRLFRGERGAVSPDERVGWHEVKSAVMFRLSQVAEVNKGCRMLITKHIVAMPAQTDPVDFGRKVQDEAVRIGILQGPQGTHGLQDG